MARNTEQDKRDEANFMSGMLSWEEVTTIATNLGFTGKTSQPGSVARFFAWRLVMNNRSILDKRERRG